ncbi:hypothetical protein CMO92_02225 [Candidatus Woesearchaeota archaeon]|nr:hypothetical protein [Candidatus Woesearchaeota archaeon]
MAEFMITYETLFDLLRKERNSAELQSLDPSFTPSLHYYLEQKQAILNQPNTGELYQITEQEKTRAQLKNIQKILKDLYDQREKKILALALNAARTKTELIHSAAFQEYEKTLYDNLIALLKESRLTNLSFAQPPFQPNHTPQTASPPTPIQTHPPQPDQPSDSKPVQTTSAPSSDPPQSTSTPSQSSQTSIQTLPPSQTTSEPRKSPSSTLSQTTQPSIPSPKQPSNPPQRPQKPSSDQTEIKFLYPVPRFLGTNLETFGPFKKEDTATLPSQIAQILIKKGHATPL